MAAKSCLTSNTDAPQDDEFYFANNHFVMLRSRLRRRLEASGVESKQLLDGMPPAGLNFSECALVLIEPGRCGLGFSIPTLTFRGAHRLP